MPMCRRRCRTPSISLSALSTMAIALCSVNAEAQERTPRSVAVVGGVYVPTDANEGRGSIVGVRFTFPASRIMLVEPGIEYVAFGADEYGSGGGGLLAEVQAQAQFGDQVRPFVGVGGGVVAGCGGICAVGIVFSASGGMRASFSNGWGGRAEVRLHGVDVPTVTSTELTIGISHVF